MATTDKPPMKYCCSNIPQLEAKILSIFSLITTLSCLFLLFLIYSHVHGQFFVSPPKNQPKQDSSTKKEAVNCTKYLNQSESNVTVASDKNNGSNYAELNEDSSVVVLNNSLIDEAQTENQSFVSTKFVNASENNTIVEIELANASFTIHNISPNINSSHQELLLNETLEKETSDTAEFEIDVKNWLKSSKCSLPTNKTNTTANPKLNSSKEMTMLDNMASFLIWSKETEIEWFLIPVIWNGIDLLRALMLLLASSKRQYWLAKAWYVLTIVTCLAALGVFVPFMTFFTSKTFQIIFVHGVILVLLYNTYALWIVYFFITESMETETEIIGESTMTVNTDIGQSNNNLSA